MVLDVLGGQGKFYIYGAQVVAYGAYLAIRHLCGKAPECFLVGSLAGNPTEMDGIPVRTPEGVPKDALIILGITELWHGETMAALRRQGFTHLFPLTQHEEHLLMSRYFASLGRFPLATESSNACQPVDFALYEVRNHKDKPIAHRPSLRPFEYTIQAGAATTGERIAPVLDNIGANISEKNRQYCEMTATYWVWKNTSHAWKGIEHYRRHLRVRPGMLVGGVDVILPLPYCCYPGTLAQFRRFVSEDVLDALLHALKALHPKKYDQYFSILRGKYQYTYNLVCARRQVFDDYCAWFFHITEYMETLADKVPEITNTRALSYVAEVLTNLYFMDHQDQWNIRHVEKAIYI